MDGPAGALAAISRWISAALSSGLLGMIFIHADRLLDPGAPCAVHDHPRSGVPASDAPSRASGHVSGVGGPSLGDARHAQPPRPGTTWPTVAADPACLQSTANVCIGWLPWMTESSWPATGVTSVMSPTFPSTDPVGDPVPTVPAGGGANVFVD